HRTFVLLLPPDDYAGHHIHYPDGLRDFTELARPARTQQLAALGADAGISLSLHCKYLGLDDCRTGASTVADLRGFSDTRRLQQSSEQRQHHIHVSWLRRAVFCARSALSFSGGP